MGDEGLYVPNCQTNFSIALYALSLLQIQAFISFYQRALWYRYSFERSRARFLSKWFRI